MDRDELLKKIQNATSITEALRLVEREGHATTLKDMLVRTMDVCQYTPQDLSRSIDVERSTLYRLISGERLTTRNVLLRIALVLSLSLDETQALLCSGQRAELYPAVKRDALLIFCITHKLTMEQTEAMLLRKGFSSLFERV
jgi:hypothetical protein